MVSSARPVNSNGAPLRARRSSRSLSFRLRPRRARRPAPENGSSCPLLRRNARIGPIGSRIRRQRGAPLDVGPQTPLAPAPSPARLRSPKSSRGEGRKTKDSSGGPEFFGVDPKKVPCLRGRSFSETPDALRRLNTSRIPSGTSGNCLAGRVLGGIGCRRTFFGWTQKKSPFFSAPKKPKKSSIRNSVKSAKIRKFA
jgi:hypothetical protein